MSTKTKHSGICSQCRYADECTYQKDPERPVIQCAEFEPCEPPPVRRVVKAPSPRRPPLDFDRFKGLCVDCEERETCTYPKPEGGVWHCEEYR